MNSSPVLDTIAKLLATENINVVRANVSTASFNLVNRTLTLPQWKNITPEIDEMLVSHEVSHALFTTEEYSVAIERATADASNSPLGFPGARTYMNILEDARVEKLMKRQYPGIRKTFATGYRQLNDMDFFDVQSRNVQSLLLIDRINLYFKVGYSCGIQFTPEEKAFVTKAEQTETISDIIDLARQIYEFSKEAHEEALEAQKELAEELAQQSPPPSDNDDEGYDVPSFGEGGYDESEEQGEGEGDSDEDSSPREGESRCELSDEQSDEQKGKYAVGSTAGQPPANRELDAPITAQAFEQRVAEIADTETVYKYFTMPDQEYDPIVGYKEIFETLDTAYDNAPVDKYTSAKVRQFKTETQNNVDYLIKEFEMKKAATSYKRSQTSKVGTLDMRKLWSYQLNTDLFKRITTVKQGKNHGMVFLLDWSGSMSSCIEDTLNQVFNLAMFCHKANIVYRVYAFNDYYIPQKAREQQANYQGNVVLQRFSLLELFSNKMTPTEMVKMLSMFTSRRFQRTFDLNGTPLNSSLIYMYHWLDSFYKENNIEKMTFITLTDGLGERVFYGQTKILGSGMKAVRVRNFLKDEVTKKNVEIPQESGPQTKMLLEMIKNRYNCKIVGFFVTQSRYSALSSAVKAHRAQVTANQVDTEVHHLKSEIRKQGYGSMLNTGRDDLFIVPTSSTKIQNHVLEIDSDASSRSIAKEFNKFMTSNKTSRILLSKFIDYVA